MGGSISSEIDRLARQDPPVQKIDVRSKSLTEIPPNINTLKALTDINASYNQIKLLPASLGQVKTLKVLNLANNRLEDLPQEITDLVGLIELNLSINKIKVLPRGFGSYKALRLLDLSHNQLEELPSQVGLLGTLKELFLSFNKLKRLPPELGKCANLEKITLSNNQIRFVPSELAQIQYLRTLELTGNKIKVLPPEVAEIPELQHLNLSLNPVIKPIDQAARKGPKALLEYLRSDAYDQEYYAVRRPPAPTHRVTRMVPRILPLAPLTSWCSTRRSTRIRTRIRRRRRRRRRTRRRRTRARPRRSDAQSLPDLVCAYNTPCASAHPPPTHRKADRARIDSRNTHERRIVLAGTPTQKWATDEGRVQQDRGQGDSGQNTRGSICVCTHRLLGGLLLEGDDGLLAHGIEDRDENLLAVVDEGADGVTELTLGELEILLGGAVGQEKAAEAVIGDSEALEHGGECGASCACGRGGVQGNQRA